MLTQILFTPNGSGKKVNLKYDIFSVGMIRAKRDTPKYKKKPSDRLKKVLDIALKNRGKLQPAMEAAGYSKNTAKNPKNITNSKSWTVLLEKAIPDKLLVNVARDGLNAICTIREGTDNPKIKPDYLIRHKYLETALKMRGKLVDKMDLSAGVGVIVGFKMVVPEIDHRPED